MEFLGWREASHEDMYMLRNFCHYHFIIIAISTMVCLVFVYLMFLLFFFTLSDFKSEVGKVGY